MKTPFFIGLTGSIGMGKSTTAAMFAAEGVPVWDADAAVHRLYGPGGAAVPLIANICPEAVADGVVDRAALKNWISREPGALKAIESIVHPLVATDRIAFIKQARSDMLLLDVPLLFETGTDAMMDATVVVSAPADVQKKRVLARSGMNEALLGAILDKQMPDDQKRARADYVVETLTLDGARKAVQSILADIRERRANA